MFYLSGLPQEVVDNYLKFLKKADEERKAKQQMEKLLKAHPPKTFSDFMSYGMYVSTLNKNL